MLGHYSRLQHLEFADLPRPSFPSHVGLLLVSAVGASKVNPARKGWEASSPGPSTVGAAQTLGFQSTYEMSSSHSSLPNK